MPEFEKSEPEKCRKLSQSQFWDIRRWGNHINFSHLRCVIIQARVTAQLNLLKFDQLRRTVNPIGLRPSSYQIAGLETLQDRITSNESGGTWSSSSSPSSSESDISHSIGNALSSSLSPSLFSNSNSGPLSSLNSTSESEDPPADVTSRPTGQDKISQLKVATTYK